MILLIAMLTSPVWALLPLIIWDPSNLGEDHPTIRAHREARDARAICDDE